ncbi:VWA domain-containing protein [Desmospora profundinema]|uniref:Mg-chelatase subunit ChlD n=1 Tax=Desmospora profundinema TaxID=1571184 RepID=A0ABU1IQ21_9BACL|nr:VWA domain-containing protein [Desmospora profundinema]MDR6226894.1 Mg-chelatase subunit ChlD [Desmospora profundinema]
MKRPLIHRTAMIPLFIFLFLATGCSLILGDSLQDSQESPKNEKDGKTEEESQQEAAAPTPPQPHVELEDILADEGIGRYAEDRYDKEKVKKELDALPEGLSDEEIYRELLALVGESYRSYMDTFDQLEQADYTQNYGELSVNAQEGERRKKEEKNTAASLRVEILLDASGSMAAKVDGGVKMDLAKEAIREFAESLPADASVSLRVYGHEGSNQKNDQALSCKKTEQVYSPGPYDPALFQKALDRFKPTGWTPLAGAIEAAEKDLLREPRPEKTLVYIVSDGVETCGGDPAEAARSLHQSDIEAVVNIIGFDVDNQGQQQLKAVADAGGGSYRTVNDKHSLSDVMKRHAADLNRINNLSYEGAVKNIDESYSRDNQLNNQTHSAMLEASKRERARMNYALNHLLERETITSENWIKVGTWIDRQRWKDIGNRADSRWRKAGSHLDSQLRDNFNQVQNQWQENGRKIDELENRTRVRIGGYRIGKARIGNPRIPNVRHHLNAPKPGTKLNDD